MNPIKFFKKLGPKVLTDTGQVLLSDRGFFVISSLQFLQSLFNVLKANGNISCAIHILIH
ncbi:hypothetical protein C7U89_01410 [Bradyrhizobium sp. WBOS4]|nr:hypothetical protein [Bradyrhizobium sp. WBOS4]